MFAGRWPPCYHQLVMSRRAPFRHAFPAAAVLALLFAFAPVPTDAAEWIGRAGDGFLVEVDGVHLPDARLFVNADRSRFLVDLPGKSQLVLVDLSRHAAVLISRSSVTPEAADGSVRVADPGDWGVPAFSLSEEGSDLRLHAVTSEVRILKSDGRPPGDRLVADKEAPAPERRRSEGPPSGRPPGHEAPAPAGASAGECLRLESRPAARAAAGCAKFVYLRNSCEVPVAAQVSRIEHLLSGTLPQTFSVVVPPEGELSLGCSWWSGAMAPSAYDVLAAEFLAAPAGRRSVKRDRPARD